MRCRSCSLSFSVRETERSTPFFSSSRSLAHTVSRRVISSLASSRAFSTSASACARSCSNRVSHFFSTKSAACSSSCFSLVSSFNSSRKTSFSVSSFRVVAVNVTFASWISSSAFLFTFCATKRNASLSRAKSFCVFSSSSLSASVASESFDFFFLVTILPPPRNGFDEATTRGAVSWSVLSSRPPSSALGFNGELSNALGRGSYTEGDFRAGDGRACAGFAEAGVVLPSRIRRGIPRLVAVSANARSASCRLDSSEETSAVVTVVTTPPPSVDMCVGRTALGSGDPGSASGSIGVPQSAKRA